MRKDDRWGSDDRYGSGGWGSNSSSDRFDSKTSTIEDIPMHKPDDDRLVFSFLVQNFVIYGGQYSIILVIRQSISFQNISRLRTLKKKN